MFAAWAPESYKTSTKKVEVESTKKRCMEDEWCIERRFLSFDKVEYSMFYICIVVSIDNMNVNQENKRIKCPLRAKPIQNPLENQAPSYQKGKNTSEN